MEDLDIRELERILKEKKKAKKESKLTNLKVMDYIVIICLMAVIIFTGVSLYQYYVNDIPVSEMKTEFFAFFGVELLGMAGIAISNNLGKRKDEGID